MADTVLAVSWRPYRGLADGAVAIGANSLTMTAAERLRGFECAVAQSCASNARVNGHLEHSWR